MTERGVSDSDMPTFPWPARPEANALDALLDGSCRPDEASAELRAVADVLVALQSPPDRREIAGWREALTIYREVAGRPAITGQPRSRPLAAAGRPPSQHRARTGRPPSRRPRPFASPLGVKLAAAAGAAAVAALGSGIAAAYTGSLPSTWQSFAHEAFAAPAPRGSVAPTPRATDRPVGPSVTGPAAYGLCHAYEQAKAHGTAHQQSVALRNLERAAGGQDMITQFCAPVPKPGNTTAPGRRVGQTGSPSDTSHGRKPTAPPGKPTSPPGKPTSPPGKPTAPPGKPTAPPGKPTTSPGKGNGNGKGKG
jgi:hypothetical protein